MTEQAEEGYDVERLWTLMEEALLSQRQASQGAAATAGQEPDDEQTNAKKKAAWRRKRRVLDALGLLWWAYVVLQVLGLDPVRWSVTSISPDLGWMADYRFLLFLVVLPLICAVFWRLKTLGYLLYIALFPFIVLFWKLPKAMFKTRDWSVAMAVVNGIGLAIRNLRYGLVSKSVGFAAVFTIVFVRSPVLLVLAASVLIVLLSWATVRTIRRTFEKSWFLTTQLQAIDSITGWKPVQQMLSIEQHRPTALPDRLDPNIASQMATAISLSIVVNKGLYFWAYQLQRYRQTRLGVIFDVVAYVWLFLGAAFTFGMSNAALHLAYPGQYSVPAGVSSVGVFAYGVSTLAFANGAGVSAVGDAANVLAVLGGLFGVCVLAIAVLDLVLTVRRERNDSALDETVDALKDRAKAQENRLRSEVDVGVDEAWRRMEQIGFGMSWLVGYVVSHMPDDIEN